MPPFISYLGTLVGTFECAINRFPVFTALCMRGADVFEFPDPIAAFFPLPSLVRWLTQLLVVLYAL